MKCFQLHGLQATVHAESQDHMSELLQYFAAVPEALVVEIDGVGTICFEVPDDPTFTTEES